MKEKEMESQLLEDIQSVVKNKFTEKTFYVWN